MRVGRSLGLLAADGGMLAWRHPDWPSLAHDLAAPHAWVDRVGADTAALGVGSAALWLLGAWFALALLAAVASAMPGAAGALASALTRLLLPAALRGVLAGAAGAGLLLAPAVASATPALAASAAGATPADAPPAPAAPGWPTDRGGPGTAPTGPPGTDGVVTVRPGDSLWAIAAGRLGPGASDAEVAAAWPRWYAANRATVGPDPALILPGQQLLVPEETS